MGSFRPDAGGVTVRLGPGEATILRDLAGQIAGLFAGAEPGDSGGGGAGGAGGPDRIPDAAELEAMVGLDSRPASGAGAPEDPVLARLLPDGYRDDPEAASDFRRFTESGLRGAKERAARTVLDSLPADGGRVRLTAEQADAWLRALNDIRLAFGVVLGIEDDSGPDPDQAPGDEQRRFAIDVYYWLGYLQDSLVTALS